MGANVLALPPSDGSARLQVMSAAEFCRRPVPAGEAELLGPLVVRGYRTLIGAATGEGKTSLALQIIRAVCAGEQFLDWTGAGGCRALLVDLEQSARTLRRRLFEFRLNLGVDVDIVRVPDGLALDQDKAEIAEFERVLDGGYDLVVLDPLYKLHRGDSMDERGVADLMRQLDRYRIEFGFALLLCAHYRKPYGTWRGASIHDICGSSVYPRGAEIVLGIHRVSPGSSRLYFHKDRDGDLPIGETWTLSFDREQGFQRNLAPTAPRLNGQVAELLRVNGSMTKKELVGELGKSVRAVEKALREIGASGRKRDGSREYVYVLPEPAPVAPAGQADRPKAA